MVAFSEYAGGQLGNLLTLILVPLIGVYLVQKFRSWYRLRHFQGPLLATLSRLWLVRLVTGSKMHTVFYDVNQKYGKFCLQNQIWLLPCAPRRASLIDRRLHCSDRSK
jgi:hypothetical protein